MSKNRFVFFHIIAFLAAGIPAAETDLTLVRELVTDLGLAREPAVDIALLHEPTADAGLVRAPTANLGMAQTLASIGNGAAIRYDPLSGRGNIGAAGHEAAFAVGLPGTQTQVLFDGGRLVKTDVPYSANGELMFSPHFVASMKTLFNDAINEDKAKYRIAAIIVDPGHGGKDAGAVGEHVINGKKVKVLEKDVVLNVSKELYSRLRAAYPDKRILMTRSADTFPSLDDRTVIANSVPLAVNEAIIYVSVHANASFNKNARGYEVWYLTPEYRRTLLDGGTATPASLLSIQNMMLEEEFTRESVMIAESIIAGFRQKFTAAFPSRGIKAEEWYVVRKSKMPAVLVELGFVTNREDAILMTTPASVRQFSEAIYLGLLDFVRQFEKSGGFVR
jgi:N-acetylmuramoyl-L-alanine amidase